MDSMWYYILLGTTVFIYLVAAFIQFRRVVLMKSRVNHLAKKGKRVPAKIRGYGYKKHVEVEFVNHSNSKVITEFKVSSNTNKLPEGSDVTILLGDKPNNSPAIALEYGSKIIVPSINKYAIFGIALTLIALLLGSVIFISDVNELLSKYIGLFIPVIAAIAIFLAVTEDEMADNRSLNLLLLYGLNATANIRKANSTGVVKQGYKQISFFLTFVDKDGNSRFGKAEAPLNTSDFQFFKENKQVNILYSANPQKRRCLLNYTWQKAV